MKNFRKVLALVLVIATLFSFVAIASAYDFADVADDAAREEDVAYYEDEAKISDTYYEGVRVLSYAGILNGYEDGTFQPQNSIRRNEMAKMIAVLANAGYPVDELYASASTFEDVPVDDWAASYVAYCAHTGIVAGRSATSFDPNASVTGLETAKMLLVVLGFEAEKQGYVGADWKINVLRDAKVMGLLENFAPSYDYNAAITREEAAHMMMNALKANCVVGYLTDASRIRVTNAFILDDTNGTEITLGSNVNLFRVDSYATLRDALKDEDDMALYGDVVVSHDILSEVLFNIETVIGADCFGRPSTYWISRANRKNTTIGVFAQTPIFASYNSNEDELGEVLQRFYTPNNGNNTTFTLWVNGVADTKTGTNALQETLDAVYAVKALNNAGTAFETAEINGKSVDVEVYTYERVVNIGTTAAPDYVSRVFVDVVMAHEYFAKVTAVNKAKGTVTFNPGSNNLSITVKNQWGFNSADVDNTAVLLQICDHDRNSDATANEIHIESLEVLEPITAEITRVEFDGKNERSFVADGETYEYAGNFGIWVAGTADAAVPGLNVDERYMYATNILGDETAGAGSWRVESLLPYDIYVDENGYVVGLEANTAANFEVVVIDGDSWVSDDPYMTGNNGWEYKINTVDLIYFEEGAPAKTTDVNTTFNSNVGVRPLDNDTLAMVTDIDDVEDVDFSATTKFGDVAAQGLMLKKGSAKAVDTTGAVVGTATDVLGNYLFNNNTQIIVRVPDYFGEEEDDFTYLYFDGINAVDATYVATEFQYFTERDLDPTINANEDRYITYVYMTAEHVYQENYAVLLSNEGYVREKLANDRFVSGEKFRAIVNGEDGVVFFQSLGYGAVGGNTALGSLMNANLVDLNGDGIGDNIFVPNMIYSEFVQIGIDIDGTPVWTNLSINNTNLIQNCDPTNPQFRIDNGVLSYVDVTNTNTQQNLPTLWAGTNVSEDCSVWVITYDKNGEFVHELVEQEEFNDYCNGYSLVNGLIWTVDVKLDNGHGDGAVDYVIAVMIDSTHSELLP